MGPRQKFDLLAYFKGSQYQNDFQKKTGKKLPADKKFPRELKEASTNFTALSNIVGHLTTLDKDEDIILGIIEEALENSEDALYQAECCILLANRRMDNAEEYLRDRNIDAAKELLPKIEKHIQDADIYIEQKEFKEENKEIESKNPALQQTLTGIRNRLAALNNILYPRNQLK